MRKKQNEENTMKKSYLLIFTLLTFGLSMFSQVKIGVVNSQEILRKSKKGSQTLQKLEGLKKAREQKIQTLQEEFKRLEKELRSPALNVGTREKKVREAEDKRINLKRFVEDAQKEMYANSQKEFSVLQDELMPIIQQVGKSKGFTLILDIANPGIVYFDNTIDITADVIKATDAKFPGK
jgi:outer membrane protein